jgi:hypothetical protein
VDGWKQVMTGLGRLIASFFTSIGTSLAVTIVVLLAIGLAVASMNVTVGIIFTVVGWALGILGGVAVLILTMTGLSLCQNSPSKNGCQQLASIAYKLMVGVVVCSVAELVLGFLSVLFFWVGVWVMSGVLWIIIMLVAGVAGLLALGSLGCFLFFLRAVAVTVYQPKYALNALLLIIGFGVVMFMGGPSIGVSFVLGTYGAILAAVAACFGGVLSFGVGVWFIVTLFLTRNIIQTYLSGQADASLGG